MGDKRKLILVSNDDGIEASGLKTLIEIVRPYGDVVVVAPDSERSGMSHSISMRGPLRAKKIFETEGFTSYSVAGTPVDCVKLGFNQFLPRVPDLMVSGINHGSNSGISLLYSGTMGAAIEASLLGIPAIGFSLLSHSPDADFSLVKKTAGKIIEKVLEEGLDPQVSLNINYPVIDEKDFKGFKICTQTQSAWCEEFDKRMDPYGKDYYWLVGKLNNLEPNNEQSDEWALKNNFAAIVPVRVDFTHRESVNKLNKWGL